MIDVINAMRSGVDPGFPKGGVRLCENSDKPILEVFFEEQKDGRCSALINVSLKS